MTKKLIVLLAAAGIFAACGNNADTGKNEGSKASKNRDPEVEKGLDLVARTGCFTCHREQDVAIGPPYQAVADKYPNNQQTIDSLSQRIIKGSVGRWGTVMMPPNGVSTQDAQVMAKYILSLKK